MTRQYPDINYAGADWHEWRAYFQEQYDSKASAIINEDLDARQVENIRGQLRVFKTLLTLDKRAVQDLTRSD